MATVTGSVHVSKPVLVRLVSERLGPIFEMVCDPSIDGYRLPLVVEDDGTAYTMVRDPGGHPERFDLAPGTYWVQAVAV